MWGEYNSRGAGACRGDYLRRRVLKRPGLAHDLARTPASGSSGGLFHILGSLSPFLKILGIIPKE